MKPLKGSAVGSTCGVSARSKNSILLATILGSLLVVAAPAADSLTFSVTMGPGFPNVAGHGRLFVVLGQTNVPEPRLLLGNAGADAPVAAAKDLHGFTPRAPAVLGQEAFVYPITNFSQLEPGEYYAQAVWAASSDNRQPNAAGNLYSRCTRIQLDPAHPKPIRLELTQQVPPESTPPDSDQVKFVQLPSKLLSDFHGRRMFLRAGVVLPRDYERDRSRQYPVWVRIGGLNARWMTVHRLMAKDSSFRNTWMADSTARFILVQLDGSGPYGDPYYINSANNGPYGDALTRELIPHIEAVFRGVGQPRARVLSGTSTGGWVSLALQIFYADFFNGVWSACPDPVDFRSLELMNIYLEPNAYVNQYGNERPSERDLEGDVVLTMRREVGAENLLGSGNSYTLSGGQWGAWNAAFSPRGDDGLPVPLWDPQTGRINHAVAHQWEKYDLRFTLERNWKTLAPKLAGKIHISSGDADQYFLNNAVHLLDQVLARVQPPFAGRIIFGPRQGHGWSDLSLAQMLAEMDAATK